MSLQSNLNSFGLQFHQLSINGDVAAFHAWIKEIRADAENKWVLAFQDSQGYSALMLAAKHGNFEILEYLLLKNCSLVEAKSKLGNSALMYACAATDIPTDARIRVVKLLIESSEKILSERNVNGDSASMWAAMSGNSDALELLAQKDASVLFQFNDEKLSVLMCAMMNASISCFNLFLRFLNLADLKKNLGSKDVRGNTALHFLLECLNESIDINEELVLLLLQNGADLYIKNQNGFSCLEVARTNPRIWLVISKYLRSQSEKRNQILSELLLNDKKNVIKTKKRLQKAQALNQERKDCDKVEEDIDTEVTPKSSLDALDRENEVSCKFQQAEGNLSISSVLADVNSGDSCFSEQCTSCRKFREAWPSAQPLDLCPVNLLHKGSSCL